MDVVALWRSGYAAVCKTAYTGSIPVGASIFSVVIFRLPQRRFFERRDRDVLPESFSSQVHLFPEADVENACILILGAAEKV